MAVLLDLRGEPTAAAPVTYTLSELGTVDWQAAFASFDGTAAGGSFLPTITVRSQNGTIIARSQPSSSVAAGASADVSWFPGLESSSSATTSGALVLLYDLAISGSDGEFDQDNIPQSYSDLLLVLIARANTAAVGVAVSLRFNNDGLGHYADEILSASGTTVGAIEENSGSSMAVAEVPGTSVASGWFGMAEIWIPGYSSSVWRKQARSLSSFGQAITTNGRDTREYQGVWNQTDAITRIQLNAGVPGGSSTLVGSTLRIYGRT